MAWDWNTLAATAWPLAVALLLGVLVHLSLRRLARTAGRHAREHLRARIAHVVAVPAATALPLLFLAIALDATPLDPALVATLRHWIALGGMLCLTWLVARVVRAVEDRILLEHPVDVEDNLAARRVQTQTRVISRVLQGAVVLVGVALALMTFPQVRQVGTALLASAGIIGLVAGVAAQPARAIRSSAGMNTSYRSFSWPYGRPTRRWPRRIKSCSCSIATTASGLSDRADWREKCR